MAGELDGYMEALQQGSDSPAIAWPTTPPAPVAGAAPAAPVDNGQSWAGGFLRSGVASVPELIGIRPAPQVEEWRAGHPVGSIASQLLAGIVPYGAGARLGTIAMESIPFTARLLASVARESPRALQAPVTAAFARGALELAPFELARIGTAALVGDEGSLGEVAASAGLDLAAGGALFGLGQAYRSIRGTASRDQAVRAFLPDYNPSAPQQQRLSQLYDLRTSGGLSADTEPVVSGAIRDLERDIRTQGAARGADYVDQLWHGADTGEVRRLFSTQSSAGLTRRRFMQSAKDGFADEASWQAAAAEASLPEGWLAQAQFPRLLEPQTQQVQQTIERVIQRNLRSVHDGWFIEREANNGLFVMARQIAPSAAAPQGRWLVLKSANPDALVGKDIFGTANNRMWNYMRKTEAPIQRAAVERLEKDSPNSLYSLTQKTRNTITPQVFTEGARAGDLEKRILGLLPERMTGLAKNESDNLNAAWQWVKGYIAPAQGQFQKAPVAEWARVMAQQIFDLARSKSSVMSFGPSSLKAGQSIVRGILRPQAPGGLEGVIRGLNNADMPIVTRLLGAETDLAGITKALQSMDSLKPGQAERIANFFRVAAEADAVKTAEIKGTEAIYGLDKFNPRDNHFGFSHLWRGDFRQRVLGDNGRLVAIGAGRSTEEALAAAKELAKRTGGSIDRKGVFRRGSAEADLELVKELLSQHKPLRSGGTPVGKLAAHQPSIYDIRKGVLGFEGDLQPLTQRELADIIHSNIRQHYEYLAKTIVEQELSHDVLDVGRRYGKEVMNQLSYRINRMAGNKGLLDKAQNDFASKALGHWLGNNAADKIVTSYNKYESTVRLLAGNLGFLTQNAVGFIQTAMPKVALLRNANPGIWQAHMGFVPDIQNGVAKGFMGFIEPLRVASQSIRSMVKPSQGQLDMLNRAAREGVLAPKFIEEFVGQKSIFGSHAADPNVQGGNRLLNLMRNLSEVPASRLEELTRAQAFLMGENLGRNMGVVDPEQLYQVAKQFAQRTMYQYSTADRSKIFNGPVGSLVGLFKNWTFNFINDFGTYAGQAARGNIAPLMWAVGGTSALAGVGGLPLYAAVDGLQRMFTDKSLMDQIYGAFNDGPNGLQTADAIYFGLPAFLGVSLQSQTSAPFSNPMRDINWLYNASVLDRARRIGTLGDYAFNQWRAGGNPFMSDRTWDLFNYALMPGLVHKMFGQIEDGAMKAIRNGEPIINGIGPAQQVLNAIGLPPTRIARAYELQAENYADRDALSAATLRLGEAYAQALERNDERAMTFIIQRAVETGADLGSVMRSAATRTRHQYLESIDTDFRRLPQAAERRARLGL